MIFSNGEQEREVKGLYSVSYPSELADGIFIDMNDTYCFISDHIEEHRELMEELSDEPAEHFDMSELEIDWDKQPHAWILRSLEKIVVSSCEEMLEE